MKARRSGTRFRVSAHSRAAVLGLALALLGSLARAQDPNLCDAPGEAPDLIVGDITSRVRWGNADGITAFSFGVANCNLGSCWANWELSTSEHPVIGQNLFRLENGRFEQIGQSWLFHEFFALSGSLCATDCEAADGAHLGVRCSNPDVANYLGLQSRLGPKSEVDPSSGIFPFPATAMTTTGGPVYKRVQVHDADLDPSLNPGARYFVELQAVSHDDAAAGRQHNNASYRPALVSGSGGTFDLSLTGATVREQPAIMAWGANDPAVVLTDLAVPGDGRLIVGAKVTQVPGGWHYEYAVQNLDSHRSAGAFSVPRPPGAGVTNPGFHDVDYHSGEPFSPADWSVTVAESAVVFSTEPYEQNANANALRWGTLYNFRFDSDAPPGAGDVAIRLFLPGSPANVSATSLAPRACAIPGEVQGLMVTRAGSAANLSWVPPVDPGGPAVTYDLLRSPSPSDFETAADCVLLPDPSNPTATDAENPPGGGLYCYLVRAKNSCPGGPGILGTASNGQPTQGRTCP